MYVELHARSNFSFLDGASHPEELVQAIHQVARGETLGADVSMLKVWATETFQRAADLIIETAGPLGAMKGGAKIGNVDVNVLAPFYKARPATIYGGSNEIQRNILAKAVLALPSA